MAEHSKHLVEYGSPVQLGGQIVEERADLERTADEHAQLTQSMNATADTVNRAAGRTATLHQRTLHSTFIQ